MLKSLNLIKQFTQAILNPASTEDTNPLEEAPAIDIWVYAEPAGEEPDPLKRNVLQWRRLISSVREPLDDFPGQPVDVIGFVHYPPYSAPDQFVVARSIIRCCLADTVPLGLIVQWQAKPWAADTWVRVRGEFARVLDHAGEEQLAIAPHRIDPIPTPQKIYINGVF